MEVQFANDDLGRLETDFAFTMKLSQGLVKAYRRRLQAIRAAVDERDLRAFRSWHFEKLQGRRSDQWSVRLNDQFRLILEFQGASPSKQVLVVSIEDYH